MTKKNMILSGALSYYWHGWLKYNKTMGITNILWKHTIYKNFQVLFSRFYAETHLYYYQMKHPRIPKQEGDCDLRMG